MKWHLAFENTAYLASRMVPLSGTGFFFVCESCLHVETARASKVSGVKEL